MEEKNIQKGREHWQSVVFEGKEYPSICSLAREYEVSYSRLSHYYARNHDIHLSMQRCLEEQGIEVSLWGKPYHGIADVAIQFGLKYASLRAKAKRMESLEKAVDTMLRAEPIRYEGKTYETLSELCAANGISQDNIYERLTYGLSLKEALTRPIKSNGNRKAVEFHGIEYPSHREVCRVYGISEHCVRGQTKTNSINFLESLQILVTLKEQANIPQEEPLNYIPACRVRGVNYKTMAGFLTLYGITGSAFYTYKSRHGYEDVFEALKAMQKETRKAYILHGKPVFQGELSKCYSSYQLKKMNLPSVGVPRYPTLQGADFDTECYDLLEMYEKLKEEITVPKEKMEWGMHLE